jgi:hypothetical protein
MSQMILIVFFAHPELMRIDLHLFFHCNSSSRIWNYLQIEWQHHDDLPVLSHAKRSFGHPFFMEVLITAC